MKICRITQLTKRGVDLMLTVLALLALGWLMVPLALLVRVRLGSPILFCQSRPGLKGKPFLMFKFRTMTDERDQNGRLIPDSERLTGLGRFLRQSSLDELPELWNVLKGEMSLVGPRPLLMAYLPLYTAHQWQRHSVKPGITGWAQIHGRNAVSWEKKFELDLWYVAHQSIWLDFKILWATIWVTLRQTGIAQPGQATMELFTGTTPKSK